MSQKKHALEKIIAMIRRVDILASKVRSIGEAVQLIGVADDLRPDFPPTFAENLFVEKPCFSSEIAFLTVHSLPVQSNKGKKTKIQNAPTTRHRSP